MKPSILLATLCWLALTPRMAPAEVPLLLNYQGTLQLPEASAADSSVRLTLAIYGSADGGTALWSESHDVTLQDGRFHLLLGSRVPLPESLFDEPERYLAVAAGDGPEMAPRQRIVSVAYAVRAAQAEDVAGRDIQPNSLVVGGGAAALDSTGTLSAAVVSAGSLSVGGVGLVGQDGSWVGPPAGLLGQGSVLDTVLVRTVADTLSFSYDQRWQTVPELNLPFSLTGPRLVDVELVSLMSALGGGLTRLAVHQLDGYVVTRRFENIGNVSGIVTDGQDVFRSAAVLNRAALSLEAGDYRAVVERQVPGSWFRLHTVRITVRLYRRLSD